MQGQGSMRTHTTIITALAAFALLCLPASALAGSPLLSGYGGPGAGEQQLVGAGLVNGGGGGGSGGHTFGGSGSGSGGGLEAGSGQRGAADTASTHHGGSESRRGGAGAPSASGRGGDGGEGPGGSTTGGGSQRGSAATQGPATSSGQPARSSAGADTISSTALGLSGDELLLAALAVLVLLCVALLTRRLAVLKSGSESADGRPMNLRRSH